VFAPDYAPEEIAEIVQRLRKAAGLPDQPTGAVANPTEGAREEGIVERVADKLTP
jgi:hypothetical protein